MYIINGYKFHTILWSEGMNSINHVRASRRYNKAYNPFIVAQQAEQVYYTPYPKGHHDWLVVIKINARSRIIHNILPQVEKEAPYQYDDFVRLQVVLHIDPDIGQEALYQDDDFVGLQVVLYIDLDVISESLVDIYDGGEEVDRQLVDQTEFDEPDKDENITTESEFKSDFNDINTF
ncbi:hypothetical protein CR513_17162, partial [Mucuna pruriens]